MEKEKKGFVIFHNVLVTILFIISGYMFYRYGTSELAKEVIIWSFISGLTYRMVFDLLEMNLYVGAMVSTFAVFIFPWWCIPFMYGLGQLIYEFSCKIVKDANTSHFSTFERAYFICGNTIVTGVLAVLFRNFMLPNNVLNLREDFVSIIIVCIVESAIGLIYIYGDLKRRDAITSIINSIANHIKETYKIYLVFMLITVNSVILYQGYGYIGLLVASSASIALSVAFGTQEKIVKVSEESYTDILTGVKNKKYYIESLPEEFDTSCAVFFIDFNGFKNINDTYGHEIGDECIIHGANILSEVVREKDDVIRFGGDEFMLLINDADREICKAVINRISTLCGEKPYVNKEAGVTFNIRMSIGVALCPEDSNKKEELCVIADEKMYDAKLDKNKQGVVYKI